MKITYLKLKHYKRFPLSDEEEREFTFDAKLTMLTGPNGCGKTATFNELTPLPSDKADFYPGGYKEIHITHNKVNYKLISDFSSGSTFSFFVEDDNLNISGNVSTQRELVRQHFGITPMIHSLLTGVESLTNMTLPVRKKLFSEITHLNIDEVLSKYTDLKDQLKVNQSLLKSRTALLNSETVKLIDKGRLEDLLKQSEGHHKEIEQLLRFREGLQRYREENVDEDSDKYMHVVRSQLDIYMRLFDSHNLALTSFSQSRLDQDTAKLIETKAYLSQLLDLYQKNEKAIKEFEGLSGHDIDAVRTRITELEQSIERYRQDMVYLDVDTDDTELINQAVLSLSVGLEDLLSEMPGNDPRVYSKTTYNQMLEKRQSLYDLQQTHVRKELQLVSNLKHLEEHSIDVNCPKCDHQWNYTRGQGSKEDLLREIQVVQVLKTQTEKELQELIKTIEDNENYFRQYIQYSGYVNRTRDALGRFWKVIADEDLIFKSPLEVRSKLHQLSVERVHFNEVKQRQYELTELKTKLELLVIAAETNLDNLIYEQEALGDDLTDFMCDRNDLEDSIRSLKDTQRLIARMTEARSILKASTVNVQMNSANLLLGRLTSLIDSELSVIKVKLIEIDGLIYDNKNVQANVDRYTEETNDILTNIKVLELILEELSPKNGLIAQSISSFLNMIILNVNSIISSVWDYKMELKVINVGDESLNYKFKVMVEDKLTISDASVCSKGMKEIIDLGFKLLLYKLLNLDHYPLFLDELGSHLDSSHVVKIVNLINNLTYSDKYSQVFLISHKEKFSFIKDMKTIQIG